METVRVEEVDIKDIEEMSAEMELSETLKLNENIADIVASESDNCDSIVNFNFDDVKEVELLDKSADRIVSMLGTIPKDDNGNPTVFLNIDKSFLADINKYRITAYDLMWIKGLHVMYPYECEYIINSSGKRTLIVLLPEISVLNYNKVEYLVKDLYCSIGLTVRLQPNDVYWRRSTITNAETKTPILPHVYAPESSGWHSCCLGDTDLYYFCSSHYINHSNGIIDYNAVIMVLNSIYSYAQSEYSDNIDNSKATLRFGDEDKSDPEININYANQLLLKTLYRDGNLRLGAFSYTLDNDCTIKYPSINSSYRKLNDLRNKVVESERGIKRDFYFRGKLVKYKIINNISIDDVVMSSFNHVYFKLNNLDINKVWEIIKLKLEKEIPQNKNMLKGILKNLEKELETLKQLHQK